MIITEIRVGYGVTINLGNFQSARPQCELTAMLEGTEDADAAIVALFDQCRARVRDMARPLLKLKDTQIEAVWADLPETARHLMQEES